LWLFYSFTVFKSNNYNSKFNTDLVVKEIIEQTQNFKKSVNYKPNDQNGFS